MGVRDMGQLPSWVQYIQALGPTGIAIVAALIAGYIAWRQWRTAHDKLSFDLYEKRFAVYEAVKSLINASTGGVIQKDLDEFYDGIRGAEFLFDGEARDFVMKIGDMAWRAKTTRAWQRSGNHPQPDKLIDEEENILNFLSVQSEEIENVFKPYLDLSRAGLKSYWPW
jgi:hypothetical protein